ncbi:hypothetical protein [Cellulomonas sp. Leaf334]|uniref:hypothetical protein n=1 Tax=Cellulomonas sp. Leaf334 TaxID=1736339 RepID=UPI0006F49E11|nr:hypothetical protein [Cellulomonas sp. Leaf334]KQR17038.1 hypothetical protein ASF78_06875 [Cellulomonas sp. Leaf334]
MSMRTRLVAVVVVALLLSGSATAYAAWSRSAAMAATPNVRSGNFAVAVSWVTPVPTTAMWPGETRTGVARVAHTGHGRWQYLVASATGTASLSGLTVTYTTFSGGACTATAIPAGAWSAVQPNGTTVDICVHATLGAGAPSAAQGTSSGFTVVISGRNQSTS